MLVRMQVSSSISFHAWVGRISLLHGLERQRKRKAGIAISAGIAFASFEKADDKTIALEKPKHIIKGHEVVVDDARKKFSRAEGKGSTSGEHRVLWLIVCLAFARAPAVVLLIVESE